MARILLHAGFAKAGSTSLQAMMTANAARLPKGIRYVPHDLPALQDFRRYARELPPDPSADALEKLRSTARWVRNHLAPVADETLILSSEDFAGGLPPRDGDDPLYAATPILLRIYLEAWAGDRVEFVLYTRERESWLRSWHGSLRYEKRFMPGWEEWSAQPRIRDFSWESVLGPVRDAVAAPLHVLALEDDSRTRLGPGTGLLRLAGVPEAALDGFTAVPPQNRGPSRALQDRVQSAWFRRLPSPLHRRLKDWLRARDGR